MQETTLLGCAFNICHDRDEGTLSKLTSRFDEGPLVIQVDGRSVDIKPSEVVLASSVAPLLLWLRNLQARHTPGRRLRVGVIGPAGAGKSYLCATLAAASGFLWGQGWAVLSMDGYHLPNAQLEATTHTDPQTGAVHSLKAMKGIIESIDGDSLAADLVRLGDVAASVDLPIYNRRTHEATQGQLHVGPEHGVVLVEGLHLLSREGVWADVGKNLDVTVFLHVDKDMCKARVIERKVAGGRSLESTEEHYWRVDSPIYEKLQEQKVHADVVLSLDDGYCPTCVQLRGTQLLCPPPAATADEGRPIERELLVLGLNPAMQRVLSFDAPWRVGDVNRASAACTGIGGKGQNLCKAVSHACRSWSLGALHVKVAQFEGGDTGRELSDLLRARGVEVVGRQVATPTRICTTLLGPAEAGQGRVVTEIVEPGGKVSQEDELALLSMIEAAGQSAAQVKGLAIMGSLPPGVSRNFYAKACAALCGLGPRGPTHVLVDTVVGLEELLHAGLPLTLLKLNAAELTSVTAAAFPSGRPGTGTLEQALEPRALWLLDQHPQLLALAVTAGPEQAHLWRRVPKSARRLHATYTIPRLPHVVNPIGAGDTCAAVTLAYMLGSPALPVERAFAWGILGASASCLQEQTAEFDTQVVDQQLMTELQLIEAWCGSED